MSTLALIVLFTTLGGALSALAASVVLFLPAGARASLLPRLVSFATGTLLGAAFMVLLPHALVDEASPGPHAVGAAMLAGILCFFLLEKFVLWRHCHDDPCEMHSPGEASRDAASARLVLVGDSFHNVLDGVLIAAAFMTDHALGIVTAIAVFSHEIPQEVGDLAILMHGGLTRLRALVLNLLTSLSSVLGGVIAYFALASALEYLPFALAFAAASFLYVAVADLIPGLHRRIDPRAGVEQVLFIGLGVAVVWFTHGRIH